MVFLIDKADYTEEFAQESRADYAAGQTRIREIEEVLKEFRPGGGYLSPWKSTKGYVCQVFYARETEFLSSDTLHGCINAMIDWFTERVNPKPEIDSSYSVLGDR